MTDYMEFWLAKFLIETALTVGAIVTAFVGYWLFILWVNRPRKYKGLRRGGSVR